MMKRGRKFKSFVSLLCAVVLLLSSGLQGYAAENTNGMDSLPDSSPEIVSEELPDTSAEEPETPGESENPEEPTDTSEEKPEEPEETKTPGESVDIPVENPEKPVDTSGKQPDISEEPKKPDSSEEAETPVDISATGSGTDGETSSGEEASVEDEEPDNEEPKLVNGGVSIENGIFINETNLIEYDTPDQEYVRSAVEADYFDRYSYRPSSGLLSLYDLAESTKELTVNIRKRAQWVDETNGDAKITLQYESNSGELSITPDMNVILIQDKSGSMDANYGYNLELTRQRWTTPNSAIEYPLLNSDGGFESIDEWKEKGADQYKAYINRPNEYTIHIGAAPGFAEVNSTTTGYNNNEMKYNSPCQETNHYYLLIFDDASVNLPAWTMVCGRNLNNIASTDLHHYELLNSRNDAMEWIEKGRRVVRVTSGVYYNARGDSVSVSENNPAYFLDVSQLHEFNGEWILSTCAPEDCQANDRLAKSQQFLDAIVDKILEVNPDNQIAYVPFWGDVPKDGKWTNWYGNSAHNGLVEATSAQYAGLLTEREGVTRLDFTTDADLLKKQIDNPFTYNGTNWSIAFQNAIDLLPDIPKDSEEKAKQTLVLFLTDGLPQGCIGSTEDYGNAEINGVGQADTLKKDIEGVTVWSIGVGVSNLDGDLSGRLETIDSEGVPFYAQYPEDFETLEEDVLERINDTYVEELYGYDAFYHDTLSEYFQLDEEALDNTWKVLSSPSAAMTNGVPTNVYDAVRINDSDTGIEKVYVRSTKTVYWYIGKMTNGGYEDSGHTISYPVKFLNYSEDTGGTDKALEANTSQYLTYYTNKEADKLCTLKIDAPKIIFNRKDSEIIVNKNVSGISTLNRTYHFVYSKDKYTSGKVVNVLGSFDITISAGSRSGTNTITGLEDGTYYIYEVDSNHVMVSPTVCTAEVDYHPAISTKSYSNRIPYSITKSDEERVSNLDNYLILASEDEVSFASGELTVVKEIDSAADIIWWEHGNPTFMVRVQGTGVDGIEYTFWHTFEFTKEYVEQNQVNGKVSMSYTFTDIPISEQYVVEEVTVSRYALASVSIEGQDGLDAGQIVDGQSSPQGFYGLRAEVNLKVKPTGLSVKLYNEKVNYTWFSHNAYVQNKIEN